MPDLTKKCTKCGAEKPLSCFFKDRSRKSGKRPDCNVCSLARTREWCNKQSPKYHRKTNLKKTHGLQWDEYMQMLDSQNFHCAICERPILAFGGMSDKNIAHVDHCHKTGMIRGLLCKDCNSGIGFLKDNSSLLKIAAEYLDFFGDNE